MGKAKKFHSQLTKSSKQSGSCSKKGRLQGSQNVFKVKANQANKSKRKTKAITSTLTRVLEYVPQRRSTYSTPAMKVIEQRKSHTSTSDRAYADLQDTLHRSKVAEKGKQVSSHSTGNKPAGLRTIKDEKLNIDETMEQFATL